MAKSKSNASLAALAGFKKAMEEKENGNPTTKIETKKDNSQTEEAIKKPEKNVKDEPIINKKEESPVKEENKTQNNSKIETNKKPKTPDSKKLKSETAAAAKPVVKKDTLDIKNNVSKKNEGRANLSLRLSEECIDYLEESAIQNDISLGKYIALIIQNEVKRGKDNELVNKYKKAEDGIILKTYKTDLETKRVADDLSKKYGLRKANFWRYVIERARQESLK